MTTTRRLLALLTALLLLGAPTSLALAGPATPEPGPAAATRPADRPDRPETRPDRGREPLLAVRGDLQRPLLLTRRDLARFPQQTVSTQFTSGGTPTTRTFTGALLIDVLNAGRPRVDARQSNDILGFAAQATATDGYQAVIAWGEIDPGFAGTQVLVALTEDGVELERPRLVVPGDVRGGRYVTDLRSLALRDLGR